MQKHQHKPGLRPLATALLALGTLAAGNQALATTAANTTIRNTVTVNYADAAGTNQAALTAQVDVLVSLVRSAPLLSAPADQTTGGANVTYNYTITTTANGPATYNLAATVVAEVGGISGSTATSFPGSVMLAATTVAASTTIAGGGATTTITVPQDAVANGNVNGFNGGETVVIGGQVLTVTAIGSDTAGAGLTTIDVSNAGAALAVTPGMLIAERQTFTVTVDPGTFIATTDQTVDVAATATDSTTPALVATDTTRTTVAAVGLSVFKYVRNVSTTGSDATEGNAAGTGSVAHCGITAYSGGVTGKPGNILEYLIVVSKSASANNATSVQVSDTIPPFTALVASSMEIDLDGDGTGAFAAVTENASDGDAGESNGSVVYFYPGGTDGGTGFGDGSDGTIGAGGKVCMKFRTTIQ